MPYLGRSSDFGVRNVFHFLAGAGDTSVSGNDADGKALVFTDGAFIDVYLNGVRLKSGEDYNTNTANTVAGISAMDANDEVNVVAYDTFNVANTVPADTGGSFGGDVTTTATFNAQGDTQAGDKANMGFTTAEGLILTGQGTTNDVTIKNDADTAVVQIPTGTTNVDIVGDVTASTLNADGDTSAGDSAAIGHTSAEGLILTGQGSTSDVTIKNDADEKVMAIPTGTRQVHIGDASANDSAIVFDGNAQDFHIGLDDSADSLTIGLGSTLGTTSHMVIDANGIITKPLQPAFLALSDTSNTNFAINTVHTVGFATEIFDNNGDFASSKFTAPVTGRYQLNALFYFEDVASSAQYLQCNLVTSNRTYYAITDGEGYDATVTYHTFTTSVLADMDAGDTAIMSYRQQAGDVQIDLSASNTYFSGYLVC